MKKMMMLLTVLIAPAAFAAPVVRPVDPAVLASASRYVHAHCSLSHSERVLVLEAASHEARRLDQNMFDHFFVLTYGLKSGASSRIDSGALVLSGERAYSEDEITWVVTSDAYGLCR